MAEVTVLKNGMTVVSDNMSKEGVVSARIAVKTGGKYENKENNGISHFLEHMAFKGTKKRNAEQIAIDFDDIGGRFNAYTASDKTVYYGKVLKEYVESAFEILSDILQHSTFTPEEIEKERDVILQEIASYKDDPTSFLFDNYMSTAYPDQPFGRPILGPEDIIKNMSRETLLQHVAQHYTANNIIVSFAGDIEHEEALNLVNKYLTEPQEKELPKAEKIVYGGGVYQQEKELEQTRCIMAFESIGIRDDFSFIKYSILSRILGGGMSSRLFQEIREKRGLCYHIMASNSSNSDTGDFSIFTAVAPERINETIDAVIEETKKLLTNVNEKELNRVKVKIKSSLIMDRSNISGRSEELMGDLMSFNRIVGIDEYKEIVDSVSIKDVKESLEKVLSSKLTFAIYGKIAGCYDYDYISKKFRA